MISFKKMESTRCHALVLLILGECLAFVVSLIEPIDLPKELDLCMEYRSSNMNITHTPFHMTQSFCMGQFMKHQHTNRPKVNFTSDETNYLNSLYRQILSESNDHEGKGRIKRQASNWRRHRQEIRAAPFRHWQNYVTAVNRLKRERSGRSGRSRYDTIAAIHTAAVDSVHFGPAFLPWHKLYLLVFETALGVPIPYWDPTIDNEMPMPTESIVWSSKYFGSGRGIVMDGPFAGSETPTGPLIRDIGNDGMLFSKSNLQRLLRNRFNREISEPTYDQLGSLEGQHNMVHFWIGGHTNEFEMASYDPLFWNLHAYVDLVWEVFRNMQEQRGVNPHTDIINSMQWDQNPYRPAIGLRGLTLLDGYSSRYRTMVTHGVVPRCPDCGNSPDMFCVRPRWVCSSIPGGYRPTQPGPINPVRLASVFSRRRVGGFMRRRRGKRSLPTKKNQLQYWQSDYKMDISDYAFLSVKVIRTQHNGRFSNQFSTITPHETQIVSPYCLQHQNNLHSNIIYVQADGLNYHGRYKDFKVSNRSSVITVGVQRPGPNMPTESLISAYDKCGRICRPYCLISRIPSPVYKQCSGAIRITLDEPLMFASFHDESEIYTFDNRQRNENLPLIFHCNF